MQLQILSARSLEHEKFRRIDGRLVSLLLLTLSRVSISVQGLYTQPVSFALVATVGENYSSSQRVFEIATDSSGNVFIVGSSDPNERGVQSDLPVAEVGGLANVDAFVSKVSSSGQVEWTFRTGTNQDDSAIAVDIDPTGHYLYVTGQTSGKFGSIPRYGGLDIFVLKYDLKTAGLPVRAWSQPAIIGSPADDAALALKVDSTGNFVYISGYTRGSLFSSSRGSADAFLCRLHASNGSVDVGRQFGTSANDFGYTLVLPESSGSPILVGAETDRYIGTYEVGNLNVFRFLPSTLDLLGSRLIQTFAREGVSGLITHPKFPTSVFACGQSWLDEMNGWDISLKHLTDLTGSLAKTGAQNLSVLDITSPQYAKRFGSQQHQQDRPTAMTMIPSSGWIIVGGTTTGAMSPVVQTSDSQNFIAAFDPLSGNLAYVAQEALPTTQSSSTIGAMATLKTDPSSLVYAATRIDESNGNQYVELSTFGLPDMVMREIAVRSPSPSPKPASSSSGQHSVPGPSSQSAFPIAAVAGGVAGGFLLAIAVAIALASHHVKKLARAEPFRKVPGEKRGKKRRRKELSQHESSSFQVPAVAPTRPPPAVTPSRVSRLGSTRFTEVEAATNTSGLV
jgi:hypothetical protein